MTPKDPVGAAPPRPYPPLLVLGVAVLAVVVLPRVPGIQLLLRPLGWLGTLLHETGHALAILALGGHVTSVNVFFDGSGVVYGARAPGSPAWHQALVSIAGLVGPAVGSVALLWAGLGPRLARAALASLGVALWLEAATLTQGFATGVALGWGGLALLAAARLPAEVLRLGTLVVAVQMALHVVRGSGYLFAAEAHLAAGPIPSDVANVATSLGGHYLLWGLLIGALDVLLLGVGLVAFFLGDRRVRDAG